MAEITKPVRQIWKGKIEIARKTGKLLGAIRFEPAQSVLSWWIHFQDARKPPIIVYAMLWELEREGLRKLESPTLILKK